MDKDMIHEVYHADTTRISKSGTDKIDQSPAHYWANYLDPNRQQRIETPAMFEGTLLHCAILEREEFKARYIVLPSEAPSRACLAHRNAKKPSEETVRNIAWWDEFLVQSAGRIIIDTSQYDKTMRITESVYRHPAAEWLLTLEADVEKVQTWTDVDTGAPCNSKPDFDIIDKQAPRLFVDLKTTTDASPKGFSYSVNSYRYDVQAAFYMDGAEAQFEPREGFFFIAVEKEPPYAVAVYNTPEDVLAVGRAKYKANLATYMECLRTGVWPAYGDDVQDLQMSKYYFSILKQI